MGRRKQNKFVQSKMIASRVEASDYWKFELLLKQEHKSLQDVVNSFVVGYISGTLTMSGNQIVSKVM